MSSVLRGNPGPPEAKTKFVSIMSLAYRNENYNNKGYTHYVLLPFTYNNGELDMNADVPGFNPSNGDGDDNGFTWRMVKAMGGDGLVHTLGSNFRTWFENWVNDNISNIQIVVAPIMTKVQMSVPSGGSILNNNYCIRYDLTRAPTSDQFVTGIPITNYDTVWIFKTPLVVSYTNNDGNTRYASLYTQFARP